MLYIELCFFYGSLRIHLSGPSLPPRKRQSHVALKQTVTSRTIWSCVQTWLALSPFPTPISSCTSPHLWWVILNPNRLLNHRPHHTVARLQPPGARRGLGAWCSISNGVRGGWSRCDQSRDGVWVGTGVEFDWAGPFRMCPSPPPSDFPITKPHSAPAQVL